MELIGGNVMGFSPIVLRRERLETNTKKVDLILFWRLVIKWLWKTDPNTTENIGKRKQK